MRVNHYRRAAVLLALIVVMVAAATSKPAYADIGCEHLDEFTGSCLIEVGEEGSGGGPRPAPVGDNDDAGSGGAAAKCTYGGREIDCTTEHGSWSPQHECYVGELDQGEAIIEMGEGPTSTGQWAMCTTPAGASSGVIWVNQIPGEDAPPPPPDPAELAQEAIAQMQLRAIDIGIVPEDEPGRVGLVGMPTWMWVADPGESTLGPIERTASTRGYSVTATAEVQRIEWNMGDGRTVTCFGEGTVYRDAFGKRPSPTCGHSYQQRGRYTVTATSYWVVDWEGIGETGTINLDFSQSTDLVIGEAQVIVTG